MQINFCGTHTEKSLKYFQFKIMSSAHKKKSIQVTFKKLKAKKQNPNFAYRLMASQCCTSLSRSYKLQGQEIREHCETDRRTYFLRPLQCYKKKILVLHFIKTFFQQYKEFTYFDMIVHHSSWKSSSQEVQAVLNSVPGMIQIHIKIEFWLSN